MEERIQWELFSCVMLTEVEAADFARFTLHRAALPEWVENSEAFTDARKADLEGVNKSLRKALEGRVSPAQFKSVTGVSMNKLFSMDGRLDVSLSADQAKKLGLVDKIVKITPQKRAEIIAQSETLATAFKPTDQELSIPKTPLKMNLAELKANHPEAYKMAVNEGIEQEKDRAGAWLTFVDVDPTAVVDGVKEGKGISQTQMVELTRKSISKSALVDAKIDSPKAEATVTDEPKNILPEQTAEIEKQAEFSAEVFKALDLKIEKV